jgi:hypothetical protein
MELQHFIRARDMRLDVLQLSVDAYVEASAEAINSPKSITATMTIVDLVHRDERFGQVRDVSHPFYLADRRRHCDDRCRVSAHTWHESKRDLENQSRKLRSSFFVTELAEDGGAGSEPDSTHPDRFGR